MELFLREKVKEAHRTSNSLDYSHKLFFKFINISTGIINVILLFKNKKCLFNQNLSVYKKCINYKLNNKSIPLRFIQTNLL